MERFLRSVRTGFLPLLTEEDLRSLETLNRRFWTWLDGEYHQEPHRGIGNRAPLTKWAQCCERVRHSGPEIDLEDLFLFEAKRLVSKARTVSLNGRLYEVDPALCRQRVVIAVGTLVSQRPPHRSGRAR